MELTGALFIGVTVVICFALLGFCCIRYCGFDEKDEPNIHSKRSSVATKSTSTCQRLPSNRMGPRHDFKINTQTCTGVQQYPYKPLPPLPDFLRNGQHNAHNTFSTPYPPQLPPIGFGYESQLNILPTNGSRAPFPINVIISNSNSYIPESVAVINEAASNIQPLNKNWNIPPSPPSYLEAIRKDPGIHH